MYLTQGLHRSIQATPDAVATVFRARVRTFSEHALRIARLAGGLRELGVKTDDRVAILALNSDRYAEYLLAVPWAGAVLNPVNIRWSVAEIAYSLNDSDTRVLLVDDTFVPMLPALRGAVPGLRTIVHCGESSTPDGTVGYEELAGRGPAVADARRGGDALAGVFYTGGTTGFPKGVMLSHRNLVTSALGTCMTGQLLGPDSVFLHAAPMFHLADLAGWCGQVLYGGPQVMVPAFQPDAVLAAVQDHRVTDILLVPTMIQVLVDHPALGGYDLSSLRRVLYGGSAISEGVLHRTLAALPGVRLTQAYGMTELAPVASLLFPDDHRHPRRRTSAGRAAPHAEIGIVTPEGAPAPTGQVGEIRVRGGHTMLGYWNRPEETAQVLRDGWMHTGDAGFLDEDGYLYVVDRIKDMIITGGENVYSAEVENALSRHPGVLLCAVVGLPSERWGETVHACVVTDPGTDVTAEALTAFLREHIAGYKVPRSIEFVPQLPVSAAGKVLKRELRAACLKERQ
ncbi:MAG TPA: long-chain-fatty-acid--CoA ligase [Rugosimonospora sp.]|nr:long-chain-fatty-acid--CoA ligase [Rugosimonospora sp.]